MDQNYLDFHLDNVVRNIIVKWVPTVVQDLFLRSRHTRMEIILYLSIYQNANSHKKETPFLYLNNLKIAEVLDVDLQELFVPTKPKILLEKKLSILKRKSGILM